MTKFGYVILLVLFVLTGCNTIPKDAFLLSPTSLQDRQTQTRIFETSNEISLLSAGIAVLQDMGYTIDGTQKDVGLVSASKTVDATDGGQVAMAIFIAALGGGNAPIDKEQKIKVSFITLPSKLDKKGYLARITFQRIVWDTTGKISRVETLGSKDLYEQFFDKLSKSVFLEAYKI
jgi:hypothetical protein